MSQCLVTDCYDKVEELYDVDGDNPQAPEGRLDLVRVAMIKVYRKMTNATYTEAVEFITGPARFAVHDLQIRVEERKQHFKEGIYG